MAEQLHFSTESSVYFPGVLITQPFAMVDIPSASLIQGVFKLKNGESFRK